MMKPSFALLLTWLFFTAFVSTTPAFAQQVPTVGNACSTGESTFWEQAGICTGGTWQRPAFQFGAATVSCVAARAGMVQWTGTKLQYCNGTAWTDFADSAGNPMFYVTTSTYNGSTADTACAAGYHMCYTGEWIGIHVDTTNNCSGCWDTSARVDNNSANASQDCNNWTSASVGDYGLAADTSPGSATGWITRADRPCSMALPVLCCSD